MSDTEKLLRQFVDDLQEESVKLTAARKGSATQPIPTTHEVINRILQSLGEVLASNYGSPGHKLALLGRGTVARPINIAGTAAAKPNGASLAQSQSGGGQVPVAALHRAGGGGTADSAPASLQGSPVRSLPSIPASNNNGSEPTSPSEEPRTSPRRNPPPIPTSPRKEPSGASRPTSPRKDQQQQQQQQQQQGEVIKEESTVVLSLPEVGSTTTPTTSSEDGSSSPEQPGSVNRTTTASLFRQSKHVSKSASNIPKWKNRFYTVSSVPREDFIDKVNAQSSVDVGTGNKNANSTTSGGSGAPKATPPAPPGGGPPKRVYSSKFASRLSRFEPLAAAIITKADSDPTPTADGQPRRILNKTPSEASINKGIVSAASSSPSGVSALSASSGVTLGGKHNSDEVKSPRSGSVSSGEAPNMERRKYIAQEIITTETTYCRDLKIIVSEYLTPLKTEEIVSGGDIRSMFSQVEVIAKISETLLNKLQVIWEAFSNGAGGLNFGKPFLELSEFMKSYASYANNYEKAMQTIQHLKKTNKKFVKFLALCDKKEVCRHHTIEDFLIIVIQRIPRYVMLLTDLLKNTPSDHEDFDSLTKATGKIKDVAEYVNTAKRNVELMQHGINIQHDLGIKDIPPARSFIAEDVMFTEPVAGYSEKDLPRVSYRVYTYSDALIFSKYKGKEQVSYKMYELATTHLVEVNSNGASTNPHDTLALILSCSNRTYYVSTAEIKEKFVKTFLAAKLDAAKEAAALEQRRRNTLDSGNGSRINDRIGSGTMSPPSPSTSPAPGSPGP